MVTSARVKTASIAGVTVFAIVIALTFAVRGIVLTSFSRIEVGEANSNVERVGRALQGRADNLRRTAQDWGPWDDTYEFIADRSPDYIEANLSPETLANLDVRYMLFFDRERRLVHGMGADRDTVEVVDVPAGFLSSVIGLDALFDLPRPDSYTAGITMTDAGPMMVAAAPVTDSSFQEPSRGTIVLATPFDETAVSGIAEQVRLRIRSMSRSDAARLTAAHERLGDGARAAEAVLLAIDDRRILGLWPVRDIGGAQVGALGVELDRETWNQGLRVARMLELAIGAFGLLLVVGVVGAVDRRMLQASRIGLEHAVAERTRDLAESEKRFRSLVDNMGEGLLALDEEGFITFANREAERLFGRQSFELRGLRATDLIAGRRDGRRVQGGVTRTVAVEAAIMQKDGQTVPVQIVAAGGGDGGVRQWLVRDVTMQQRYERQLLHLASHDHLTGLANRRRFEEELARELARAERGGGFGVVLWLDLDDFKEVNDSLGHRAGDELLIAVSRHLVAHTRASGVVARIGGDEFALLLPDVAFVDTEAMMRRLLEELRAKRFAVSGHELRVSASVGAVRYPDHGVTVEELLSRADTAMYSAKEAGSGGYAMWSGGAGDEATRSRLEWSERIRTAIETDTIVVFAQPIVDSVTGDVANHELLMRLPGDEPGQLIMPGDFLPAAERLGLIRDLDRWMTLHAIRLVAENPDLGIVHVNLSGRAFSDSELLSLVEDEFARTGADPPTGSASRSPRPRPYPTYRMPGVSSGGCEGSAARCRSTTSAAGSRPSTTSRTCPSTGSRSTAPSSSSSSRARLTGTSSVPSSGSPQRLASTQSPNTSKTRPRSTSSATLESPSSRVTTSGGPCRSRR